MKRVFFIPLLFLFVHLGYSQAYNHVIKTNPIGLAFGNFNATYEHVISPSSSLTLGANYFYKFLGVDVSSFGVNLGYRYYFTHKKKDVPTGFNINPRFGFDYAKFTEEDDISSTQFSVGFTLGYQWAWDSGFTLDLGLGPNYYNFFGDIEDVDIDASGIWPSLIIAIGYAF